ncbi:hypothetical protein [Croceicoccus gelatinilyticus]|uniref:hypothetical protein n=1 Tax=Croceicoccus gelatinilyticus TaxID=2835536 RepID=UPI001BD0A057|nr:hypothetical protein [Croceicoccus gelatinilyticus]MBS7671529.1 hypothetical protein [Croceicoccus gelatinilyticus]
MARMNHARHAHRGRATESATIPRRADWHPNQAAPGGAVRVYSAEERAAWARANGFAA